MKRIRLLLTVLLISVSVLSCKTVPDTPTIILPESIDRPVIVRLSDTGEIILTEDGEIKETGYFIYENPKTIDEYRHNFLVMMNYAIRLEDYIGLIEKQVIVK